MKTYAEVAMMAWDEAMRTLPVEQRNWPTVLEAVAAAVIAEHEKRTFETVWLVKDEDGSYVMSPSGRTRTTEQSEAWRFEDNGLATRIARRVGGGVVHVTRRKK